MHIQNVEKSLTSIESAQAAVREAMEKWIAQVSRFVQLVL